MTAANLTNFNRYNAILKRIIKREKKLSWRNWSEKLCPNTPLKKIFSDIRKLKNCGVPNSYNYMYNDPAMVREYLDKVCTETDRNEFNSSPDAANN